ncbi:MAG: membrane fusion protein (multidrug efflux system) [Candidatus Pseudothioglobus sp.]|jgi:membrane fusion protein (multidrug efflux system)
MSNIDSSAAGRSNSWSKTNIGALLTLVLGSLWLGWWFFERTGFVFVNDARVAADMISISSRIPGRVTYLDAREGQIVEAEEQLAMIDDDQIRLQIESIEASLTTLNAEYQRQQKQLVMTQRRVESNVKTKQSQLTVSVTALKEAETNLTQSGLDLQRASTLHNDKLISDDLWERNNLTHQTNQQRHQRRAAEVETARAEILKAQAAEAELGVIDAELLITRTRQNKLAIDKQQLLKSQADHQIKSPIHGVVDETFVNAGEYVYPGQRIAMLHNPQAVWIKANIKETEIRHILINNLVLISVDAWPDLSFHGRVERIGQAATSQFALLPSPNPSGNFTKVTQRLEVKISIDDPRGLLKPGMMVELQINAG